MTALLANGDSRNRRRRSLRVFAAAFGALTAAAASAVTLAPEAAADHDTVGGGSFSVANSDSPCTDFEAGGIMYTACAGSWVNLTAPAKYIVVPLGPHLSVSCSTFTPNGMLFETATENLAEVPRKQQFWYQQGWGEYTPMAMCQLW